MEEHLESKNRTLLRRTILGERDLMLQSEQQERSSRICSRLFRLEEVQRAGTVFVYMHFRSEVQTEEFINLCLLLGKTVTIPFTVPDEKRLLAVRITDPVRDVEPGFHGIPEPAQSLRQKNRYFDPQDIDIAIVPGTVFDRGGGRLGYGGGYYDRFLCQGAARALRIAVAYEMQLVENVPLERHDQLMDMVVTEENIYDCRRNRHAKDSSLS